MKYFLYPLAVVLLPVTVVFGFFYGFCDGLLRATLDEIERLA